MQEYIAAMSISCSTRLAILGQVVRAKPLRKSNWMVNANAG